MLEDYRGWRIDHAYVGYHGTHNDYEAWSEGEGEWCSNGLHVHGMTVEDVKAQIDDKIEEMEDV